MNLRMHQIPRCRLTGGRSNRTVVAAITCVLLALLVSPARPQGYQLPPPEVVELLDAAPTPAVRLSPDARWMLVVERPAMPSLADVARPWVGLAGLRVDPARNALYQVWFHTGMILRDLANEHSRHVELPAGARIASIDWSHTGDRFAFTLAVDDGIELWVCDTAGAAPRRVAESLNPLAGDFQWMPDGESLLVAVVPEDRGPAPERSPVPGGPVIQETSGRVSPARTFQDLLTDEHDAQLFEHYASAQLAIIDAGSGAIATLGSPGLIHGFEPSPDGQRLLVTTLQRPFSYTLPFYRFARRIEIWSRSGEFEHTVADLPLADTVPIEGVRTGPRGVRWRPGEPATVVWVEALDGGDPRQEVSHRDAWFALAAPFSEPRELLRTEHRARGLTWFADPARVMASEYDRDRRWIREILHDLDDPARPGEMLEDRSIHDRYGDPGRILTRIQADGTRVVRQVGPWIFRAGAGDSPLGARPFLDRQDLKTGATERLWHCEAGQYESFVTIADVGDDAVPRIVTRHEAPTASPNLHLRDLNDQSVTPLTAFLDPQPQIRGVQKQLVTYERADGVPLSATLYLPADYEPGTRLPLIVWAYPRDYTDPETAGQIRGSPHRFTQIRGISHLIFLTQGYAVMDNATMPIVGDPETMNDTFVEQIRMSARAAIDTAVEMGVADRDRVGIGGHSYGAFMAANLLAHTDLFRAGCARSGAYNRTLTPFGFQAERRTLWEAPEIYTAVSPFMHADKIDQPLLILHGAKDNNSGTFPMQSERLYQAIAGHGGTARLVMLPEEGHGYVARESVLHTAAEMIAWFDRYVKPHATEQ